MTQTPHLAIGDFVTGMTGVQAYTITNVVMMNKVDPVRPLRWSTVGAL